MSLFWVGNENPRVIVMAKVMVGVCHLLPEEEGAASRPLKVRLNSVKNSQGKRVDSFTNEEKTFFIKTLMTETYPEAVLIYRDKSGSSDSRTSRITDVVKSGCLVSYRAERDTILRRPSSSRRGPTDCKSWSTTREGQKTEEGCQRKR